MTSSLKAFDVFLKIFLVAGAVFYWPGVLAYQPQILFFQHSAMVFWGLSFFVPKRREISNIYLALILFYALLSTVLVHFDPAARVTLFNLFMGLITLKVIAERVDLKLKEIGIVLIGFCLLNLAWMGMQIFNQDPLLSPVNFDKKSTVELVGLLNAKFALGVYAAICAPFLAAVHPAFALLAVPMLIASRTSTCMGAFVISMTFLLWYKLKSLEFSKNYKLWKWAFYITASLIVIGGSCYILFYDAPTGQFMKRIKIWQFGFHYLGTGASLAKNIWFGDGLGSWAATQFQTLQENGEPEWWSWAHNDWFQYIFEQGLVGGILLWAYFKNMFKNFRLNQDSVYVLSAFIALAVCSMFHFPFHVGRLAGISIYILALMEVYSKKEIENEKMFNPPVSSRVRVERPGVGLGNGNGSR